MSVTAPATPVPAPGTETPPAGSSAPAAAGPTPAELLEFVRTTAANARLVATLPLDPENRTWVQLVGPGGSEAWL
ncbi:cysteine dioxygenase, partial [Streptomyces sp. SID11233]|nr:cysteine dioxygenase [Streptomyces sp. SID11233]